MRPRYGWVGAVDKAVQLPELRICMADLGEQFGCGLSEAELVYLMAHEYALSAEDILKRRKTSAYLHLGPAQKTS